MLYTFSPSSFESHGFRPKKNNPTKQHINISHRLNLYSVVLKSLVKGEFCLTVCEHSFSSYTSLASYYTVLLQQVVMKLLELLDFKYNVKTISSCSFYTCRKTQIIQIIFIHQHRMELSIPYTFLQGIKARLSEGDSLGF